MAGPAEEGLHGTSRVRSDDRRQSLAWRLPLLLFFLIAGACLWYLDRRLVSDYRSSAAAEAARLGLALMSTLDHRAAVLRLAAGAVASASTERERDERFRSLALDLTITTADFYALYRLDSAGWVVARAPRALRPDRSAAEHFPLPPRRELASTLPTAEHPRDGVMTGLGGPGGDTLGIVIVAPVVRGERVAGFVGGTVPSDALVRSAVGSAPHEPFPFRIRTGPDGAVIGESLERPPSRPAEIVGSAIPLPGGGAWLVEIGVEPLQPLFHRVMLWGVGLVLLALVYTLLAREDARAERLARHSANLERLSRNLLDANVQLQERAREVTEANHAKSRFLANVSHELRTPLNAIIGYNSLATGGVFGDAPPPLRTVLERMGVAANHLLALVNDVLDLSKIEAGHLDVEAHPVHVERVLEEVVAVVEPIADAKGLRIDLVVGGDVAAITSDPQYVRQIVLNLASNAIKFTERGAVTITARRSGEGAHDGVTIDVEDTGIGIATHDQGRIFDEFEQVRPGGRGDSLTRGAGLGLTVARKLARLLGGDIAVESTVGSGSRFTLTLPNRFTDTDGAEPSARGQRSPPPRDALDEAEVSSSTVHGLDDAGLRG